MAGSHPRLDHFWKGGLTLLKITTTTITITITSIRITITIITIITIITVTGARISLKMEQLLTMPLGKINI